MSNIKKHNVIRRMCYCLFVKIMRLVRKIMKLVYKFDKWHCFYYYDKPYAIDIVKFCNKLINKESALEIGCGLGDIIRRLKFIHKNGWDISQEVLRAARLFSWLQLSKVEFMQANFLCDTPQKKYDVIICVNWIHVISPDVLRERLHYLFNCNLNDNGYLIIDTVQEKSYKYNHNINFLTKGLKSNTEKIGDYCFSREVFAIKKTFMQKSICD